MCSRIEDSIRPVSSVQGRPTVRVLFVDDEELVRRAFRRSMRRKGIEVVEAESGEEALAIHEGDERGFDVVVTDLNMGRMSGLELIEHLAARGIDRFVVMSGVGIIETSSQVPGVVYVEKPWEPARVADVIHALAAVATQEVHAA